MVTWYSGSGGSSEQLVLHDPRHRSESAGPDQQAAPTVSDEARPAVRIGSSKDGTIPMKPARVKQPSDTQPTARRGLS